MATQNIIPDAYIGREQALIKHHVLEKYLEKLTAILAVSNPVFEFTYIDCFAGPWQASEAEMHTTSIAISLRVLEKCKKTIEARGGRAVIRALYVEQSDSAYPYLEKYLSQHTPAGITTKSIHGEFVESKQIILDWVGDTGQAFFFIDPKGWKEVKVNVLSQLLKRPRSEFVINFMYDFINRTVSMERFATEMQDLLGEPLAQELLADDREMFILNTYRKNLKVQVPNQRINYPVRSAYVKILDPEKERTKYHLVYVTTHPKGVIKFMETCEGAEILQSNVRAQIRDDKKAEKARMNDLFSDDEPYVDDSKTKLAEPEIDSFWIKHIGVERRYDEATFADILENNTWSPAQLQASLVRLIAQSKVENLDASRPRRSKPLHYDVRGGERLRVILQ